MVRKQAHYFRNPNANILQAGPKTAQISAPITDIIPAEVLFPALQNMLLHADTIELVRVLPKILAHMSDADRAMIFDKPTDHIGQEVWDEISKTRPHILQEGFNKGNPENYFHKLASTHEGAKVAPGGEIFSLTA